MKKITAYFLAVLLVLGLAACGNSTEPGQGSDADASNVVSADEGGGFGQEENSSADDSVSADSKDGASQDTAPEGAATGENGETSTVYFTSDISPEGLMAVYEALNWEPTGKVEAVHRGAAGQQLPRSGADQGSGAVR